MDAKVANDHFEVMFVHVASLLIYTVIMASTYLVWRLTEPYATGIGSAVLLSVVLRHRFDANKVHDAHVEALAIASRDSLRRVPWLWWTSYLVPSLSVHLYRNIDHAAIFNGLGKYPMLQTSRFLRAAVALATLGYLFHCLQGMQVLGWFALGVVTVTLIAGVFLSDLSMQSLQRKMNLALLLVIMALFVRASAEEAGQFKADAVDLALYIQSVGVNIPSAAIENAPIMVSNYLFSENATAVMMELVASLPAKDGSSDSMTVLEAIAYAWESALEGDLEKVQRLVPSNYTAALGEIGLTVTNHAKNAGLAIVNTLVSAVLFTLAIVYEAGLFYFVLRFLDDQDHTVVYFVAKRILSWMSQNEADNERRALLCEQDLTEKFDMLFQSYWHLAVFNFGATYFVQSFFHAKYVLVSGWHSVIFSVIPIGVPVSLPCWITAAVFASQQRYSDALWILLVTFFVQTYGGLIKFISVKTSPLQDSKNAPTVTDTSVMATSVIVGFVSFGLKGIVVGPVTLITVRELWKACSYKAPTQASPAKDPSAVDITTPAKADDPATNIATPAKTDAGTTTVEKADAEKET